MKKDKSLVVVVKVPSLKEAHKNPKLHKAMQVSQEETLQRAVMAKLERRRK